jgi:hypothetical protein
MSQKGGFAPEPCWRERNVRYATTRRITTFGLSIAIATKLLRSEGKPVHIFLVHPTTERPRQRGSVMAKR